MSVHDLLQKERFYYTLPNSVYKDLSPDDQTFLRNQFVLWSNEIEGEDFYPYGKTVASLEEGKKLGQTPVWKGHVEALNYILDSYSQAPLCTISLKETHRILTKDLEDDCKPGKYRKVPVYALNHRGDARFYPPHEKIPQLMRSYQKDIERFEASDEITMDKLVLNHAYYEWIHPHVDGNGRTGRLGLLFNSLRYLDEWIIVPSLTSSDYTLYLNSLKTTFGKRHKKLLST